MNNKIIWGAVVLSLILGVWALSRPVGVIKTIEKVATGQSLGAIVGPDYYENFIFHAAVSSKNLVLTPTIGFSASTTLSHSQSGAIIVQATTTGIVVELPAVANKGAYFKFVVGSAFATNNFKIGSKQGETDKIQGTLEVAGAVVDCDAEDYINFIADGENVGDFIELFSDGTSWIIGASGGLTSAKITCTS